MAELRHVYGEPEDWAKSGIQYRDGMACLWHARRLGASGNS